MKSVERFAERIDWFVIWRTESGAYPAAKHDRVSFQFLGRNQMLKCRRRWEGEFSLPFLLHKQSVVILVQNFNSMKLEQLIGRGGVYFLGLWLRCQGSQNRILGAN